MSTIAAGNTLTTGFVASSDTTGNLVFQTNGTTTALTLTTSQNANVVGSVSSVNTFGFKNRIINGGMTIDQRNAGASITPIDTQYLTDRWLYRGGQAGKFTAQQNAGSVTPPAGFINYLGLTSTSAFTPAASDYFQLRQIIEGFNIADLGWGTANAKTVTLSFWVRSSLTGQFGGAIRNNPAFTYTYPFTFTISSANTWTQVSITIVGPNASQGVWNTNNTAGLEVVFDLGSGATYLASSGGSWQAGIFQGVTGDVKVVSTNGATFYLTGVQLEVGTQATSFDFRSYPTEFGMCCRYYQVQTTKLYSCNDATNTIFNGTWVTKRATPTATLTGITPTGLFPFVDGYGSYVAGIAYREVSKVTSDAELQ
jgi:hypothetical protein